MKIIRTDNFGRENVAEVLIAENVSEKYGVKIVILLNSHVGSQSSAFYKLENNKYVLWRGMEEKI